MIIDLSSVLNHLKPWGSLDNTENANYATYYSDGEQAQVCLVSFGYSMKDSLEERRTALEAAVKSRGSAAVVDRLEFLHQAWIGTRSFVHVVELDLDFVRACGESPEFQIDGHYI